MDLTGWRIAAMRRMLCERATDLDVSVATGAAGARPNGDSGTGGRYPVRRTSRSAADEGVQ